MNQNIISPKRRYPESEMATALVRWFDYAHKGLGCPSADLLIHCKNEGKQSPIAGARMKAQGVRSGVSDYLLLVARREFHGLALELKAPNGKLSQAQADWLDLVQNQGFEACVAYSLTEAMEHIVWYCGN